MEVENYSHKFKAGRFTVEMRVSQGKIQFTSTHQQQNFMMVAHYTDSNLPSRVKAYFQTIKQLFYFLRENSGKVECIEGVGLKTMLHISRQNTKQIVIPLQMISLPQQSKIQKLYTKAKTTIKQLQEQNHILRQKVKILTNQNQVLQYNVTNLQGQIIFHRRQKQQMKGKFAQLQSASEKQYEKPNSNFLMFPFDPDTSIIANDIQRKGNFWIKKGHYGCLLVNKNSFLLPVSSISVKITKSKYKGIYIGVLRQFKAGRQPQWVGSKSAFLQMEGGKRAFKDWNDYTEQSVSPINQGQTITITVNSTQRTITWSKNLQKLCSCEAPKTNLYAFVRLKQEGDSLVI